MHDNGSDPHARGDTQLAPRSISLHATLDGVEATEHLGRQLAAAAPARAVVYLGGDLGAGKTTLARAFLRQLGVTGAVRSPTYTLIERYPVAGGDVAHLDLYRIADPEELEFLGLDDLAADAHLWLVEWPERGTGALPSADLHIALAVQGNARSVRLDATSAIGAAWLSQLGGVGQAEQPVEAD